MRAVGMALVALLGLTGCPKEEGPLEKAGRELDSVADDVADKARELSGEGAMEKFGRKMDDAAETAKEALDEAAEAFEDLGK